MLTADDLKALTATAQTTGWAVGNGEVWQLRFVARQLGWREVATRPGDDPVDVLKPRTKEMARSRSLSALHGLDAQPLHTDGAHLSIPPRVIALVSEVASTTPTRLKKLEKPDFWGYPTFLRDGVFLVRNHPNSFLCTAAIMKGRFVAGIRFDPGCMEACDARAREAAEFSVSSQKVLYTNTTGALTRYCS